MASLQNLPRRAWEDIVLSDIQDIDEIAYVGPNDTISDGGSDLNTDRTDHTEVAEFTINLDNDNQGSVSQEGSGQEYETRTFLTTYLQNRFFTITKPGFHSVTFIMLNLMGILYAIGQVKIDLLFEEYSNTNLKYFVYLGYSVNNLLYRCYFFFFLCCFHRKNVFVMVESMKSWKTVNQSGVIEKLVFPTVSTLYITSLASGMLWPNFSAASEWGWEFDQILLFRSYDFSLTTLKWKTFNDTIDMVKFYGTNINTKTLFMAAAGTVVNISGDAQNNLIIDISVASAFTMYHFTQDFIHFIQSPENSQDFPEIWKKYNMLRDFSKLLDQNFGLLLQFLHIGNLLFCAFFLFSHVIAGSVNSLTFLHVLYLLKVMCFYIISSKASDVNSVFREWIRKSFPEGATPFVENSWHVRTFTILDELSNDPIGVGSNMFFIDRAFVWKFTSVVGSYFMFFIQSSTVADAEQ